MTSGIVTEAKLLKASIAISLIGLFFLYLYATEITLETVSGIENLPIDASVTITGRVSKVTQKEKVAFLDIENHQIEKTKVFLFKDQNIWIHTGDYVEITGTIEEYEGEKEIIGNSVIIKGK
jgi:aspartyl/asparaginyl-tRNA synthetase